MTVFGITEKGKYRKENQDAILIRQKGKSGLFIVADGVGGGVNSAEVSSYITESYAEWWDGIFLRRERDGFQLLF